MNTTIGDESGSIMAVYGRIGEYHSEAEECSLSTYVLSFLEIYLYIIVEHDTYFQVNYKMTTKVLELFSLIEAGIMQTSVVKLIVM